MKISNLIKSLILTGTFLTGSLMFNGIGKANAQIFKHKNLVPLYETEIPLKFLKISKEEKYSLDKICEYTGKNVRENYEWGRIGIRHNKVVKLDLECWDSKLSYCLKLTEVPSEIGNLKNLKWLYLESNQLKFLPPEIEKLENLELLDLFGNKFSSFPPEIEKLKKLRRLELGGNEQLSSLSPEIEKLKKLKYLDLAFNPLNKESVKIVERLRKNKVYVRY